MKLVIQRVSSAQVKVNEKIVGKIASGLLILLGVRKGDKPEFVDQLAEKVLKLRILSDEKDKMNLNILQVRGEILLVSQFTLYADTTKGNRPSFIKAADPDLARDLYKRFVQKLIESGVRVETGKFGAYMMIESIADGPVTIVLEQPEATFPPFPPPMWTSFAHRDR